MKFNVTSTLRSTRATVLLSVAMVAIAGCHHKAPVSSAPPPPSPTPTANLSADPLAVDLGQRVTLTWRTTDATSVSIDGLGPVDLNGTQTVTPSSSTNFHLVARGDGGTAEANVRVTVRAAAPAAATPAPVTESAETDASADKIFHENVPDIFFDYDSYSLRSEGQSAAQKAAAYLKAHPDIKIVIGGYCDERGSAEYNLALGENRANSAKSALVSDGVAASRVRVVSFGKEKQFCSEQSESCYQQNRRAQFSIDR